MNALMDPRFPPRRGMPAILKVGLVFLVACLIAGVFLLLYSLQSVVTDTGNMP